MGDDDQVIYGYHGADPAFLVDFEKLFPEALSYDLGINFRCPRGVVEGARSLLERNRMRLKKTIEADADSVEGGLEIARVDWTREAKGVFEKIEGWISSGVSPSQVAVLGASQLDPPTDLCRAHAAQHTLRLRPQSTAS